MLRTLLIVLLLSVECVVVHAAPADSTLWNGISRVAVMIRQQQTDSALSHVRCLMPLADSLHSRQALVSLHSQGAACLLAKGLTADAVSELQAGTSVCEQGSWLKTSVEGGTQQWLSLCVSMYVQLAVISEKTGNRQTAVSATSKALPWIAMHSDKAIRTKALLALGGLLTDAVGKERAKQLLTEAFYDAKDLGSKDMTLMAATYLLELGVNEKLLAMEPTDHATQKPQLAAEHKDTSVNEDKPQATLRQSPALTHPKEKGKDNAQPLDDTGWGFAIGLIAAAGLMAVFTAYAVWQRRAYRRRQEHSFIEGREEERRRLARELHDGISNQLLAVQMKLDGEGNTEQVRQLLDESREQVRRVSHGLMPPDFAYATLAEAVSSYIAELNGSSTCDISCDVSPADFDWTTIPPEQSLAVYRIVQEAVGNALQHSSASLIAVGIHLRGNELVTTVSTDGATTSPPTGHGIGLRSMRERAEQIGAVLNMTHGSYGHTVTLTLPL